ncbi:MAG: hypothetical protein K8U57_02250 [Planctomycetes bacterium]|nr:hypothetical protein [Planctomycetota bacterium]
MRRWPAVPMLLGAVGGVVFCAHPAKAQAPGAKSVAETFLTADGLELHGLFTKSLKTPGKDPVVILLYPPGKNNAMAKGGWNGLALFLATEGYNVLQFDWRGHGKSTEIKDTARFWNIQKPDDQYAPNPFSSLWNSPKLIRGAPTEGGKKGKLKNDFFYADLIDPVKYTPTYLIDLAAARHHLDTKNDAGDVNTSSIYLVGSDIAASIGMGWVATEWNRPGFLWTASAILPNGPGTFPTYRYVPQPYPGGLPNELGGHDISGAIWLSAAKTPAIPDQVLKNWVAKTAPKLRDNNPMLFLYAPRDSKAKTQADFFEELLGATFAREVKDGKALNGVELVGANLETEETILKYLASLQKNRAKLLRKNRGFTAPWSIQLAPDDNLAGPGFGFVRP